MTLSTEQLNQLVAMLSNLPYREVAPIMNFLQKLLGEAAKAAADKPKE